METIEKNLDDLTAFHFVATELSFSRAAEKLGRSKSLMSKQIRRIEYLTKVQLFKRTTRSISLTEEGRILLDYSEKILRYSREAEKSLNAVREGVSGRIKLSMPISLGTAVIRSFLPAISKQLPQVQFEIDLSNENRDFLSDGIDFAIRATEDHDPNLVARRIGRIKDVICISPKLLSRISLREDPRKLASQECILYSNDSLWNSWILVSHKKEEIAVDVSGRYVTNLYESARQLCLDGYGIARLPFYSAADDLKAKRLVRLFPDYSIATHPLFLVHERRAYKTKKHDVARNMILKWFAENKIFFC